MSFKFVQQILTFSYHRCCGLVGVLLSEACSEASTCFTLSAMKQQIFDAILRELEVELDRLNGANQHASTAAVEMKKSLGCFALSFFCSIGLAG